MGKIKTVFPGPSTYSYVPTNLYKSSRNSRGLKFLTTSRHFGFKNGKLSIRIIVNTANRFYQKHICNLTMT